MNDFIVSLMLLGAIGSNDGQLPYWSTAGQWGLMPETSGALTVIRANTGFDESKTLQWRWGSSLAANASAESKHLMVDELYASLRWQCFTLDLGQKRRALDFMAPDAGLGSLSVTGGHVVESGNARTMPGYLVSLDPVVVPLTAGRLWLYGAYGDYRTTDERYVADALVHRTRVGLRLDITDRLAFRGELDHYAIWGGHHPTEDDITINFANYFRVVTGSSAGSDGNMSDRINVIGDQGGSELFRLEYRGDGWRAEAQHDIPYADGSGMGFLNFPDGINTLHFGFDDKDRWISDLLYEYHYTMYQSGPINGEMFDKDGNSLTPKGVSTVGGDNYFNNGFYRSGWTHYGHMIGDPLFFPVGTHARTWTADDITQGLENTRFKAHHVGVGGKLWRRHPYKLMLTWSDNYGNYGKPYAGESQWGHEWGTVKETGIRQFSAAFMGSFNDIFGVRGLSAMYGLYVDRGELLPDNSGISFGIRYCLDK